MAKKYESDMTGAEKRQAELKKLKSMTGKQKVQYIFDYYKFVFIIILIVIVVVYAGVQIYQNSQTKELLSIAVTDVNYGSEESSEQLKQDLLDSIGTGNKREAISLDTSITTGDDYTTSMKMAVVMSAGTTDILICDQETYESCVEQGAFKQWDEVLENTDQYSGYLEDGKINLAKSEKWESYQLTSYEPVYAGVLVSSDNDQAVEEFIQFYCK